MDAKVRSLVIGGGGLSGIAWATGLLFGLEQAGIELRRAERLVGTSAGSAVTAQLSSPVSLGELYERQLLGVVRELPGRLGAVDVLRLTLPMALHRDRPRAMRAVGRFASGRGRDRAEARSAVISARLDGAQWNPERDLRITAVDAGSGQRIVFQSGGRATLAQAVEASCAVPGVWPVVTIDGRRYVDGGMWSPANVDLAAGSTRVIVLAPSPRAPRRSLTPAAELQALGVPGRVIAPDAEAEAALGPNPLDPAARRSAAEAGFAQGRREAERVIAVWHEDDPGSHRSADSPAR